MPKVSQPPPMYPEHRASHGLSRPMDSPIDQMESISIRHSARAMAADALLRCAMEELSHDGTSAAAIRLIIGEARFLLGFITRLGVGEEEALAVRDFLRALQGKEGAK